MSFCGAMATKMWDLFLLHGGMMGNNSTQGWAVLILMLAFTFLSPFIVLRRQHPVPRAGRREHGRRDLVVS
jgi:hypothetical protein